MSLIIYVNFKVFDWIYKLNNNHVMLFYLKKKVWKKQDMFSILGEYKLNMRYFYVF